MKFSYLWLQEYFSQPLPPPHQLGEILTMRAFEVTEVKRFGKDWVLDIDVLPNRAPDCFSHWGLAREIGAILKIKPKFSYSSSETENPDLKRFVEIKIRNRSACPRYSAKIFLNPKIKASPLWIQKRLLACGLRPINNVVDLTNYVMLETGQPLHAFDGDKIVGKEIIVRFAKKGEKITTLEGKKLILDQKILVIADKKRPLAIAGIKGGKEAGIDKNTKVVVVESANFSPYPIRYGSRKLRLRTDASSRFENGIDPHLTTIALSRLAELMKEVSQAQPTKGVIDVGAIKPRQKIRLLRLEKIRSVLGVKIKEKEVVSILKRLSFGVRKKKKGVFSVTVPSFRLDIDLEEDLIEEVGQLYGYENIPARFPKSIIVPPEKNLDIFWQEFARDILKELGFTEVYNYSFLNEKLITLFGFEKDNLLSLKNPISKEYGFLRPSLIPGLLLNLKTNYKRFKKIKIFEVGRVYYQKNKKIKEGNRLAVLIFNKEKENFFFLKGIIETLLNKMAISDVWYDQDEPHQEIKSLTWEGERWAEIKTGNKKIGLVGQLSQEILKALKINQEAFVFEINFDQLKTIASEEQEYQPISPYPAAIRDISLLVPRYTLVDEVLRVIQQAGGILVKDVDLFDIYEGENIPEGKKSLAFHIIYQAPDHTLSPKEINHLQEKIIKALERNTGWEVRR